MMPEHQLFPHHPKDNGGYGPFLPALPTPRCYCGFLAFVKQSRHPESAGHAFYVCQLKRRASSVDSYLQGCNFYQWIDGHDKFDKMIMLFPYDPWKSCPYDEFARWVAPPLNPPEMSDEEKIDATLYRLANRPSCHCGLEAFLQLPSKDGLFTPFYRCRVRDSVSDIVSNEFWNLLCVVHIMTLELHVFL